MATTTLGNGNVTTSVTGSTTAGNGTDNIMLNGSGDTLKVGNGNDTLSVTGNNDTVQAGNGSDTTTVTGNNDTVQAGNGSDTTTITGNNDTVTDGNGNDTISITGNTDIVIAGNGNDIVSINGSIDSVTLGNGNNTVTIVGGNTGTDTVKTGNGINTFIENINANYGSHQIITSGTNIDTMVLYGTANQRSLLSDAISAFNSANHTQTFHFGNYAGGLLNLDLTGVDKIQWNTVANSAPVAVNDTPPSYTETSTPPTGVVISGNVLTNDHDPDAGDVLTVTSVGLVGGALTSVGPVVGTYGTVTFNANGTYSYTLNNTTALQLTQNQHVQDSFTYYISDGQGGVDHASLSINITGYQYQHFSAPALPAFGNVQDGTTVTQTEVITLNGDTIPITGLSFSGANASDFHITGAVVNGNGTESVSIAFDPSIIGTESAALNISDGNPANNQSVALSGFGFQPFSAILNPLNFGNVQGGTKVVNFTTETIDLNGDSVNLSFTGANAADFHLASLSIDGSAFTSLGDINSFSSQSLTNLITTNATLSFLVDFDPSVVGPETATLNISDGNPANSQSVALSGFGTDPLTVNPNTLPSWNLSTGQTLSLDTLFVEASPTLEGSLIYSASLVGGGSLPIGITITPNGILSVAANIADQTDQISITATDTLGFMTTDSVTLHVTDPLSIFSPILDFGTHVPIQVGGPTALNAISSLTTIQSAVFSGPNASDFRLGNPTLSSDGESYIYPIDFFPTNPGVSESASVLVTDSLGNSKTISLSGTGVVPTNYIYTVVNSGTFTPQPGVNYVVNLSGNNITLDASNLDFGGTGNDTLDPLTGSVDPLTGSTELLLPPPSVSLSLSSFPFGRLLTNSTLLQTETVGYDQTQYTLVGFTYSFAKTNSTDLLTNPSNFKITGDSVGNGTFNVGFTPTVVGLEQVTLSVTMSFRDILGDPTTITDSFLLSGTGVAPSTLLQGGSSASLNFASKIIGTKSVIQAETVLLSTATVLQPGGDSIKSVTLTGANASDFTASIVSPPANGKENVNIIFNPLLTDLPGVKTATLEIQEASGTFQTINLTGTAIGSFSVASNSNTLTNGTVYFGYVKPSSTPLPVSTPTSMVVHETLALKSDTIQSVKIINTHIETFSSANVLMSNSIVTNNDYSYSATYTPTSGDIAVKITPSAYTPASGVMTAIEKATLQITDSYGTIQQVELSTTIYSNPTITAATTAQQAQSNAIFFSDPSVILTNNVDSLNMILPASFNLLSSTDHTFYEINNLFNASGNPVTITATENVPGNVTYSFNLSVPHFSPLIVTNIAPTDTLQFNNWSQLPQTTLSQFTTVVNDGSGHAQVEILNSSAVVVGTIDLQNVAYVPGHSSLSDYSAFFTVGFAPLVNTSFTPHPSMSGLSVANVFTAYNDDSLTYKLMATDVSNNQSANNFSIDANGVITGTPTTNDLGGVKFTITAIDPLQGNAYSEETFTLTHVASFTAPTVLNLGNDQVGDKLIGVSTIETITYTVGDVVNAILPADITGANAGDFSASLIPGIVSGEQYLQVTFNASVAGDETATLTLRDNNGNIQDIALSGTGINDAPIATYTSQTGYFLSGTSLYENFSDPNVGYGDNLTFSLLNAPVGLSIEPGLGTLSYSFAPNQHYKLLSGVSIEATGLGGLSATIPLNAVFDPTYYTGGILYDTGANTTLNATQSNQVLIAIDSGVTLNAGAANEFLLGASTNDMINLLNGSSNDQVYVGSATNTVTDSSSGGNSTSMLDASGGANTLNFTGNHDTINGGSYNDTINLLTGHSNSVFVGSTINTVTDADTSGLFNAIYIEDALGGANTLNITGNHDQIFGGSYNDTINLFRGGSQGIFEVTVQHGTNTITDNSSGGNSIGMDDALGNANTLNFTGNHDLIFAGGYNDTINLLNGSNNTVFDGFVGTGATGFTNIITDYSNGGNSVVISDDPGGINTLNFTGSHDRIFGGQYNDTINLLTGYGNSVFVGSTINTVTDTDTSGLFNAIYIEDALGGVNTLNVTGNYDKIFGGSYNDTINVFRGGSQGMLDVGVQDGTNTITDNSSGGNDIGMMDALGGVNTLNFASNNDLIFTGGYHDTINLLNGSNNTVYDGFVGTGATGFTNTITDYSNGGNSVVVSDASGGVNTLNFTGSYDTIFEGLYNDTINLLNGSSNDMVHVGGGEVTTVIDSSSGGNSISMGYTPGGANALNFAGSHDTIVGIPYNTINLLTGSSTDNTVTIGSGNNTIIDNSNGGNTFAFNLGSGQMGVDTLFTNSISNQINGNLTFHGVPQTQGSDTNNVNALILSITNDGGNHAEIHFTNGGTLDFINITYTGQTSIDQLVSTAHLHSVLV